jgi:hypothetical protein
MSTLPGAMTLSDGLERSRTPYFAYADAGGERGAPRPDFDRMLSTLEEPHDGPRGIAVASIRHLFRSRGDRERVDRLISDGKLHVMSADEGFCTEQPGGMERYEAFADLVLLAYEGDWPGLAASTRHGIADVLVDEVLAVWLRAWGAADDQLEPALEDVRNRLHALVARWDRPEQLDPLIAAFLEVAVQHEPSELTVRLRALALLGVRNSALEDLHIGDGVIEQYHWPMLTRAAAHALARIAEAPADDASVALDPFADVIEEHPTAAAALTVLASMSPGQEASWTRPAVDPPAVPKGDVVQRLLPGGHEERHAMDAGISVRLAGMLELRARDEGVFVVPSLKHISRDPSTLFKVVDVLLAHGATIATANLQITPTRIVWREDVTDYNSADARWTGLPGIPADIGKLEVGRNDPCPCGSGKKYKRCCGG